MGETLAFGIPMLMVKEENLTNDCGAQRELFS